MSTPDKGAALAALKARRQQVAGGISAGADARAVHSEPQRDPAAAPLSAAAPAPVAAPKPAPGGHAAGGPDGPAASGPKATAAAAGGAEEDGPLPTRTVEAFAWVCGTCARECVPVRSESRCLCGHRLKEHGPASSKASSKCKSAKCGCRNFFFVVAEGAWVLRCRCKHKHVEHDPATRCCAKAGCGCGAFDSPWVCNCDHPWGDHRQLVQNKEVVSVRDMTGGLALAEVGGGGAAREVNDYDGLKRGGAGAAAGGGL